MYLKIEYSHLTHLKDTYLKTVRYGKQLMKTQELKP